MPTIAIGSSTPCSSSRMRRCAWRNSVVALRSALVSRDPSATELPLEDLEKLVVRGRLEVLVDTSVAVAVRGLAVCAVEQEHTQPGAHAVASAVVRGHRLEQRVELVELLIDAGLRRSTAIAD